MKKQAILLMLCLAAVLVSVSAVSAATDWYVNDTGGDDTSGDGSSIAPYLTIGKGVSSAADGDTVIIAPGEYTGTGNKNIAIDKDITIQGSGEDQTTINCEDSGHAFTVNNGKNVTIKDLTIENGDASDGGAIENHGELTINDVTFKDNNANYLGGAIENYAWPGSSSKLIVIDSTFTGNTAGYGGAIYNSFDSTATITGCIFTGNQALGNIMMPANGGAIYNVLGTVTVEDSIFTGNSAHRFGGAIFNYEGSFTVSNSIFNGNTGNAGGAINNDGGPLTVTGCTFTGNTANEYYGGAIYTTGIIDAADKPTVITGNTITGNNGVGIYVGDSDNINIHFNRIEGNTPFGLIKWNSIVEAQYNWWGTNTPTYIEQPEKPTTYYDIWNDNSLPVCTVNYAPWLILSIKADPSTIYTGQSSSITADLYADSAGGNHQSESSKYPAEIPITFSTNLGTLNGGNSLNTVLKLGTITIPLLANQGPGLATITGSVDRQKVQTTVNILQAPVTPQEPTTPSGNEVSAVTVTEGTVGMQETGIPIAGLILAVLMLAGGLVTSKK